MNYKFIDFCMNELFSTDNIHDLKIFYSLYDSNESYIVDNIQSYANEFSLPYDETKNIILSVLNNLINKYSI